MQSGPNDRGAYILSNEYFVVKKRSEGNDNLNHISIKYESSNVSIKYAKKWQKITLIFNPLPVTRHH